MSHIHVKTFPGFKSEKIQETAPGRFRVYLREPASGNAANKRLLLVMAEYLHVPAEKLRIISGHKHQNKTLEILI